MSHAEILSCTSHPKAFMRVGALFSSSNDLSPMSARYLMVPIIRYYSRSYVVQRSSQGRSAPVLPPYVNIHHVSCFSKVFSLVLSFHHTLTSTNLTAQHSHFDQNPTYLTSGMFLGTIANPWSSFRTTFLLLCVIKVFSIITFALAIAYVKQLYHAPLEHDSPDLNPKRWSTG